MANFYWYGGTGNWIDFANHWSGNSGNSPADPKANVPTSSDDVFIDANSGFGGGGTITIGPNIVEMRNFTSNSGHTYTISGQKTMDIYGNVILEAGLTLGGPTNAFKMNTSTTASFTVNGATINRQLWIAGTGTVTLQDDLVLTGAVNELWVENGTFDANDHNVTAGDVYLGFSATNPILTMGNGTWTLSSDDTSWDPPWTVDETTGPCTVTVNAEGSTIKLTSTTANNKTFTGAGKTYNNLWIAGNETGTFILTGSNTFNDLKIDAKNTVKFTQGTTTTVTTFTATGTAGNLITLDSVDGATQHILTKASGVVICDYLDISNSNALGGAIWIAGSNSLNSGNNTGWLFQGVPEDISRITGLIKKEKMSGEVYQE